MGKTPLPRPETLTDLSPVISEPINRIPLQKSPDAGQFDDLDFGDYGEDLDYEEFIGNFGSKFGADQISPKYVQENLLIDEAIAWDARDAFIESVATKVILIVPAFILGLIVGIILWAFYIFLYKARIRFFGSTTASSENLNTEMGGRNEPKTDSSLETIPKTPSAPPQIPSVSSPSEVNDIREIPVPHKVELSQQKVKGRSRSNRISVSEIASDNTGL